MKYTIRELSSSEYKILEDFLYEAIFLPEGVDSPSRDIIKQPELQLYISEFGKEDDNAFVAEIDGKVVGAVWNRIMNDYGHIDDRTPSFAISLYKEYRGLGIGTEMMRQMLLVSRRKGIERLLLLFSKQTMQSECINRLVLKLWIRMKKNILWFAI